jgi:trk system potassium uptake protein TrkA
VLVEDEMGRRLAPDVLSPTSSDLAEYASSFRVVPWLPPAKMLGKSLLELDLRKRFEITVLGYFREADGKQGKKPRPNVPTPDYRVQAGDTLLIIGLHEAVERFLALD